MGMKPLSFLSVTDEGRSTNIGLCCLNRTLVFVRFPPSFLCAEPRQQEHRYTKLWGLLCVKSQLTAITSTSFLILAIRRNRSQWLPVCFLAFMSRRPFAADWGSTAGLNDSSNPSLLELTEAEAL